MKGFDTQISASLNNKLLFINTYHFLTMEDDPVNNTVQSKAAPKKKQPYRGKAVQRHTMNNSERGKVEKSSQPILLD